MRWPELSYVSVDDFIIAKAAGRNVLHLGCAGDYLEYGRDAVLHCRLGEVAKSLTGIEIQLASLERVRSLLPEDTGGRIRYYQANVEDLDFLAGKTFDLVLAASIIEHLSNPGNMLRHFRRLCSPGGAVIIVTPSPFGVLQFMRVAIRRNEAANPEHTAYFSPAVLSELCRRYGLEATGWRTGYGWRPDSLAWRVKYAVGVPFFKIFPQLGGSLIGMFQPSVQR
jgi:2-polyprenyl-3-methyl-5-hydroxy-6-metoxy-1,4-benzoquinol methylase